LSLDLTKVAGQVTRMIALLKGSGTSKRDILAFARQTMQDADYDTLKRKVALSAGKTPWLVAGLVDPLMSKVQGPAKPEEYTVIATDGSQIEVDRHRPARCFLLNVGTVMLRYGKSPAAELTNHPTLYSTDEELAIRPQDETDDREQAIEGALLDIKRSVEECVYLADMAESLPAGPAIALMDGTLILWALSGKTYPNFVTEALMTNGMLKQLDRLKKISDIKQLAAASYISYPRGDEVINSLRVSLCKHEIAVSDNCKSCVSRECARLNGISDRDLFAELLAPGERSARFTSNSSILSNYGPHRVYFFYLNAGEELARVEVPEWVAANGQLMDLAHALILDQCRKGLGYPVALSESHEQAVVTGADRENFWQLVESTLIEEHLPETGSIKSKSKRTRSI
jgi:hypothetical protein